jgi:hypothetical protein
MQLPTLMTCFTYHYEYGPTDCIGNMHGPMPNIKMEKLKQKNKNDQEAINEGFKGLQISMKNQGDSHKKGCCCSFTLKQFYLHPTIGKICYGTF